MGYTLDHGLDVYFANVKERKMTLFSKNLSKPVKKSALFAILARFRFI
jgi:hypothetical protein